MNRKWFVLVAVIIISFVGVVKSFNHSNHYSYPSCSSFSAGSGNVRYEPIYENGLLKINYVVSGNICKISIVNSSITENGVSIIVKAGKGACGNMKQSITLNVGRKPEMIDIVTLFPKGNGTVSMECVVWN